MGVICRAEDVIKAKNDEFYFNEFFKKNKGIIVSCINKVFGSVRDACLSCNIEIDDLFAIGSVGFYKAVKYFDASKGCEFSTYAYPLIIGELKKFKRDHSSFIRKSRTVLDVLYQFYLIKSKNEDISLDDAFDIISNIKDKDGKLKFSKNDIENAKNALMQEVISVEDLTFIDKNGKETHYEDFIPDKKDIEEEVLNNVFLENLKDEVFMYFTEKQKEIFKLSVLKGLNQLEICKVLNINQPDVSRNLIKIRQIVDIYLSFSAMGGNKMGRDKYSKHIEFLISYIKTSFEVPEYKNMNKIFEDKGLEPIQRQAFIYLRSKVLKILESQGFDIKNIKINYERKYSNRIKINNEYTEKVKTEYNKDNKQMESIRKSLINVSDDKTIFVNKENITHEDLELIFQVINLLLKTEKIVNLNLKLKLTDNSIK